MHVLFVIDELIVRGGSEKSLFILADGLAARGVRVTVCCFQAGEFAKEFEQNGSFAFFGLDVKRVYDLSGIRAVVWLKNYIKDEQVDIVQSIHTASDLLVPIASLIAKRKVAVLSSRRDLGFTKKKSHIIAQRFLNRYVTAILANSEAVKEAVISQERYPSSKIKVIYNGIDPKKYNAGNYKRRWEELLRENRISLPIVAIGSAGNLNPIKGQRILIDAMQVLLKQYSNLYLFLAGDGPERGNLERQAEEYGIEKHIIFLGNISYISEFLQGLQIYIQPSFSEGFSNSILEAMASGCAVIATSVGGNPEAILDDYDGLLIDPNNSNEMSEKVFSFLINEEKREIFSKRSIEKINNIFSLEIMFENYINFYDFNSQPRR